MTPASPDPKARFSDQVDPLRARQEFARILRPGGWVVLVWNERRGYEALLQAYGTDYSQVDHRNVAANLATLPGFFGGPYRLAHFDNIQMFDYAGFEARVLSSSYTPSPGHPNYAPMLAVLRQLYDRRQQAGQVAFEYDTKLYYGRLTPG